MSLDEDKGYLIPISNDNNYFAIVSEQDVDLVKNYKWARYDNKSRLPIILTRINNKNVHMHHLILGKPKTKNENVIHKNNNELDNRRSNITYILRKNNFTRKYENAKVIEDDDTKIHPILQKYKANKKAEVFNLFNNKLNGSDHDSGYNTLSLITNEGSILNKQRHIFVYECFNGVVPEGYEIDHIDKNKKNNNLSNLQSLSVADHHIKTIKDNPDIGKKTGLKLSKPIIAINLETLVETKYNSLTEASRDLEGTTIRKICAVLKGNQKTHRGYTFKYQEIQENIEEYWICLLNPMFKGIEVSNLGRIKSKKGIITNGRLHNSYMRTSVSQNAKAKNIFVHRLICEAFHGKNPDTKIYTVDHIDRNKCNNHELNLRWATRLQQRINSSDIKSVQVFDLNYNIIGIYDTLTAISNSLNIDRRTIINYCNNGKNYNEYYFKFIEK